MVSSVYRKKRDRPVVRIVLGVIIVSLLVLPVASFFYHLNGDSGDYSNSELLIVPTDSMDAGPTEYEISTIPKDSIIMVHILTDAEKHELKVGDVITFYQDGIYKVHRIVIISGDTIIAEGDASSSADPPILIEEVKGKVVGVSTIIGDLVSAVWRMVRNPALLLSIGAILIVIMLYYTFVVLHILREEEISENIKSGTVEK